MWYDNTSFQSAAEIPGGARLHVSSKATASRASGYWERRGDKVRWVELGVGYSIAPPGTTIADAPVVESGWERPDPFWKNLVKDLAYSWAGRVTFNWLGSLFEKGIPIYRSVQGQSVPLWGGLGASKWTALLEMGMASIGTYAWYDYTFGPVTDQDEASFWLGFSWAGWGRSFDLYASSPSWSEELLQAGKNLGKAAIEAGKKILDTPVVTISYNPFWWEELTGPSRIDWDDATRSLPFILK